LRAAALRTKITRPMRARATYLRDVAVFVPGYVALAWASHIEPAGPFAIAPWNPQPALAIVWMLLGGLRYAPAVFVAIFFAELFVRGTPAGPAFALLVALVLAAGYATIAAALRTLLAPNPALRTARELTAFVLAIGAGTAALGAAFVGLLQALAPAAESGFGELWLRFWVGDTVGMLVTAPLLLVAADGARRRALAGLARRPETAAQAAVLVATLWLIFDDALGNDPARHFYLLFAPLIWIAARGGMHAAAAAALVVQIGAVLGMKTALGARLPAVELQALVAAFTLTGLYLGMMVEERERAAEGLRQTLRLAAAGEMAGAIAHEVNQPLTALANYGQVAQRFVGEGAGSDPRLAELIAKMLAEAQRAADVVRRLRDLFREGTTRLERVGIETLLAAARRIGAHQIGARPIAFEASAEPGLGALYVDRLQVELVLRNLIANAVEAIGERPGRIALVARRHGIGQVRFVLTDSGPGIAPGAGERIFEPLRSGKPSGMGLGLAISRAIAEAHGGALEARAAAHGEFHLTLPCAQAGD
jgi:signal transduction histidine kinase